MHGDKWRFLANDFRNLRDPPFFRRVVLFLSLYPVSSLTGISPIRTPREWVCFSSPSPRGLAYEKLNKIRYCTLRSCVFTLFSFPLAKEDGDIGFSLVRDLSLARAARSKSSRSMEFGSDRAILVFSQSRERRHQLMWHMAVPQTMNARHDGRFSRGDYLSFLFFSFFLPTHPVPACVVVRFKCK